MSSVFGSNYRCEHLFINEHQIKKLPMIILRMHANSNYRNWTLSNRGVEYRMPDFDQENYWAVIQKPVCHSNLAYFVNCHEVSINCPHSCINPAACKAIKKCEFGPRSGGGWEPLTSRPTTCSARRGDSQEREWVVHIHLMLKVIKITYTPRGW
jgi:hypothetical protein